MPAALNEWPTGPSAAADFCNKIGHVWTPAAQQSGLLFDPPTDPQQFVYLANDPVELLETAKRELERDREAAQACGPAVREVELQRRLRPETGRSRAG